MLCPEVWKFDPPEISDKIIDGSFVNESAKKHIAYIIGKHYFNHVISVVIPDTGTQNLPTEINNLLSEDCDYYRIENIKVEEFVNCAFTEGYVKQGQLHVLSINTQIDTGNCLAITPCGKLVLSLIKETYQELGLEGKLSQFCKKEDNRYIIHIDLKSDLLRPGKKYYDRVRWCLTNNFEPISVILAWIPNEKSICPSSVASYFNSLGYKVYLSKPKIQSRTSYSIPVPIFDTSSNIRYCTPAELLEWIGIHSIGADLEMENYDYLSSYQIPEDSVKFGQVLYLKATGFYTSAQVLETFDAIRSYLSSRPHLPWLSLHVQGFLDSPISWGLKEHQFYTNGDNSYTIVIKPDDRFILQTVISSNKRPK